MKRRSFLAKSIVGGISVTGIGSLTANAAARDEKMPAKARVVFRMGVCADLHHDLIKDGPERLQQFITEMNKVKPDFILQMGDFCVPKPENQAIMDIWNQFKGPKYHVIGNHDVDGGFNHDQVVSFWNAKGKYYSFDTNGYHFVVLNANEKRPPGEIKGYPRSILQEQLNWMKQDLDTTKLPVIVFCHQGIDNDMDGVYEGDMIRVAFERANQKAGFKKVRLVLSGHNHENYLNTYNNIHYLQINSMSYQFYHLKQGYDFALTKDPLWAFITVYDDGTIEVKGRQSSYINPKSADELRDYDGYPTDPTISDRIIKV
jgi:3',5'-cyclic AMP phosphodiesterase CpdA